MPSAASERLLEQDVAGETKLLSSPDSVTDAEPVLATQVVAVASHEMISFRGNTLPALDRPDAVEAVVALPAPTLAVPASAIEADRGFEPASAELPELPAADPVDVDARAPELAAAVDESAALHPILIGGAIAMLLLLSHHIAMRR
jgi:hypothetical protein